jgi:Kazal-type serine protease inhibitor domain
MRCALGVVAKLALCAALGCGSDRVLLAVIARDGGSEPDAGDDAGPSDAGSSARDGSPDDAGALCMRDRTCAEGEFCETLGCAVELGLCATRPVLCSDDPGPVCGCDGVTYFNDCVRRREGVAMASDGECGTRGRACDTSAPCASGHVCARLLASSDACAADVVGRCWLLPTECGGSRFGGDRFAPCDAPGACVDACTALRSETPHALERHCVRPQSVPSP